jgi:hypothetical protein
VTGVQTCALPISPQHTSNQARKPQAKMVCHNSTFLSFRLDSALVFENFELLSAALPKGQMLYSKA